MAITKIGTTGISNNLDIPGYLYLSGDNKELRFYNGANYMILKASGSLSNNYTITLPVDDGTSGQFLKTDGGGVLSWDAAGGGKLELINTVVADNDATLTISGVVGYDTYLIIVSGLHPSNDNANMRMRFGDSGGIDSGSTDYAWHQTALEPSSTSYSATASTGANYISLNNSGTGTDTGESFGGVWWLFAPDDDSAMPMISGHQVGVRSATSAIGGGGVIANRTSVIALTQVQILPHANTIISGRMTIYGVAHD